MIILTDIKKIQMYRYLNITWKDHKEIKLEFNYSKCKATSHECFQFQSLDVICVKRLDMVFLFEYICCWPGTCHLTVTSIIWFIDFTQINGYILCFDYYVCCSATINDRSIIRLTSYTFCTWSNMMSDSCFMSPGISGIKLLKYIFCTCTRKTTNENDVPNI